MSWQPGETIPKVDYGSVLVAVKLYHLDHVIVGEATYCPDGDGSGEFWWANQFGLYHADPISHHGPILWWQPLPAPPEPPQ